MDSPRVESRPAARPAHLSTVRAVAAPAVDPTVPADEVVLARAYPPSLPSCRFGQAGDSVRIRAHVRAQAVTVPDRRSLYWRVVSSVTDVVATWVDGDGLLHVELGCRA